MALLPLRAIDHSQIPLRIAVLGCGQISRRVYAPILLELKNQVQVTALCDLDGARANEMASKMFPKARVYTQAHAMLAEEQLDAALVLTSEAANAIAAKKVLEKGEIAIYLEKPPAVKVDDLLDLIQKERDKREPIYAAFNRRHMSLFQDVRSLASTVTRISGVLSRKDREVASFPFTCVHLLDSVQYYCKSMFEEIEVQFSQNGVSFWSITGRLKSGASVHLTFTPNIGYEEENLLLETPDETCEMHFPDSDGISPKARLVRRNATGKLIDEVIDSGRSAVEVMGYGPCLRDFISHLQAGDLESTVHRLSSSRRTIEILEEMQKVQQEGVVLRPR